MIGRRRGQARHLGLGFLSGRLSRTVLAEFEGSTRLAGFVLGLRRWAGAVRHRCEVAVHGPTAAAYWFWRPKAPNDAEPTKTGA